MKKAPPGNCPAEIVRQLQGRVRRIEGARRRDDEPPISTGCAALDALLPAGGLQRGTLLEWFPAPPGSHGGSQRGSGAGTLAMLLARAALGEGGALVVMDRRRTFYPPAAAALGIDWERLILVRAPSEADELWALDQALRCPGVAAVWAPLEKLGAHDFRRLQLAAETSGAIGLLLRPSRLRGQPSWAHLQLLVTPRLRAASQQPGPSSSVNRRLRVELIRIRGAAISNTTKTIELEIDEQTAAMRAVDSRSPVFSTARRRESG